MATTTRSTPTSGRPVAAVVVAACLFGATGTIAAIGPSTLPPFAAGVWRSVIGAATLAAMSLAQRPVFATRSTERRWIWIGAVGVAAYQLAFFEAVARTGVALGTLVTIGLGPLAAGVLDVALTRHRPEPRWIVGTIAAIVGVVVLTAGATHLDPLGVGLAVVAACSFPVFGAATQRLIQTRGLLPALASTFGGGALLLAPLAVVTAPSVWSSWGSIGTVVALGVATLAVAYVFWGIGLRSLTLGEVVTTTLVEPAMAAMLAVVVLGEPLTAALAIGLLLIGAGVRSATGSGPRGDQPGPAPFVADDNTSSSLIAPGSLRPATSRRASR